MDAPARLVTASVALVAVAMAASLFLGNEQSLRARPRQLPTVVHAPATPTAARQRIAIAWLPETVTRFAPLLEAAGAAHGIDPELLAVVTLVESGGYSRARSPSGARGLMQVMVGTGRFIASERGLADPGEDLYLPETNVDFGAWYLAEQLRRFATDDPDASLERAAAAYNGGPGNLAKHLADEGELSDQTVRYRAWVAGMYGERRQQRSSTFRAWLDAGGDRLLAQAKAEMDRPTP